jgi:Leucine rich repeat
MVCASQRFITSFRNCTIPGGMKEVPVSQFDLDVEIIYIRGPRNQLTIGPIFRNFNKLQVLTILDSNVPAIGVHSFWGVPSLRYLDLSKNNITQITTDDFRGQDSLLELNLSKNKMDRMPSSAFRHLGVSNFLHVFVMCLYEFSQPFFVLRFQNLTTLNLADNSLEEIVPRLFFQLGKLRILDLSGNPLTELPPDPFRDITVSKKTYTTNGLPVTQLSSTGFARVKVSQLSVVAHQSPALLFLARPHRTGLGRQPNLVFGPCRIRVSSSSEAVAFGRQQLVICCRQHVLQSAQFAVFR